MLTHPEVLSIPLLSISAPMAKSAEGNVCPHQNCPEKAYTQAYSAPCYGSRVLSRWSGQITHKQCQLHETQFSLTSSSWALVISICAWGCRVATICRAGRKVKHKPLPFRVVVMFQWSGNKGTIRFHDDGDDKNSCWRHRKLQPLLDLYSFPLSGKDIDQKQYEIKAFFR